MFSLVLGHIVAQIVILGVFSFGWHTVADTYRMVACGHGAFELCLPSLGILYQITMLRNTILGRTPKTSESWGEEGRFGHRVGLGRGIGSCNIMPWGRWVWLYFFERYLLRMYWA